MSGEEASQLGDDDDGEHSDDPAGIKKLIQPSQGEAKRRENAARLERKQRKKAEKAELARLADKRRKKEVKLNKLSSISGVNGSSGKPGGGISDKECFVCGEKGHVKRDCPQRGKRKNEDHLGGDIKRSKPPLDY